jgi:Domain of unknown function (DUF6438)
MIRMFISAGAMLALSSLVLAEGETPAPLAKPGETYVSLQVQGCANKCPSFEIYVFDTGRMIFRSNNEFTADKGVVHKNGMRSVYERIAKYLQDTGALAGQAECTPGKSDPSVATVQASQPQLQKAAWSSGCTNQIEKGRSVVKVFVNQTGMWRLINSDTRYWEKYWEDPEMTGHSEASR